MEEAFLKKNPQTSRTQEIAACILNSTRNPKEKKNKTLNERKWAEFTVPRRNQRRMK